MKRRVFLGLPVILGILFYIWYIFHASDNVAYSVISGWSIRICRM